MAKYVTEKNRILSKKLTVKFSPPKKGKIKVSKFYGKVEVVS